MKWSDKWRFWFFGFLIIGSFAVLTVSLANVQIVANTEYGELAQSTITKTISERGERGQIVDINGITLAYNRPTYNVDFYRTPSNNSKEQNARYSSAIWEAIKLIESEGKSIKYKFWMERGEDGVWRFNTGTTDEGVAAAREKMFRSNFYIKTTPEENIYEDLCETYQIHKIDEHFLENEKLTEEDKLKVLAVWQEMQMNAFNTTPITLAQDVTWATVIEVEARQSTLDGVSIRVDSQRVYPRGTLACHILGYTGLIHENQIDNYLAMGYQHNDSVGLDGVERSMEQWLTGSSALRRGYTQYEINRSGRRIRQLDYQAPTDGNTVKLTIDVGMQQVAEEALTKIIADIRTEQERLMRDGAWLEKNREEVLKYQADGTIPKLAQSGAIIVTDMDFRILAMASAPNYDPNLFVLGMTPEERERVMLDDRKPLFNNAIQAQSTPGSVFKMVTSLAALVNGVFTLEETISDEGYYDKYDTVNPPKCWIALGSRSKHRDQDIVEGLANSCNYFFYELSSRLYEQGNLLYEYAEKLGLTSKTNIDLPGEAKSVVASQTTLYDPSMPINGDDQGTWYPVQIRAALRKHFTEVGESYQITYSQERMDKCIKALMDMAVTTEQGTDAITWTTKIRPILMEELGMTMEMVWRAPIVSPIVERLNEIKWGGSYAILTGVGLSFTTITPIAMSRYITAIANGGYVYDAQIIDSIIAPDGEILQAFNNPILVNDLSEEVAPYIKSIHEGMKNVVDESGTAEKYFRGWEYRARTAGKTGTANVTKLDIENNAWFVAYAPIEDPQIAIVVYVPNGYSGAMTSPAAKTIIDYYMNSLVDDVEYVPPAVNSLTQ